MSAIAPINLYTMPSQADSDAQIIKLWLHGRPETTTTAYTHALTRYRRFLAGKPIRAVTLNDMQGFADSLADLAPNSQLTHLRAIKSLLSFAFRLGYLPFNVGAAVRLPAARDQLHERYLTEEEVGRMLALETHPRNRLMLAVLYVGGLRRSELCGLRWRDTQAKGDAGLLVVRGKGNKTRSVLLPPDLWAELMEHRGNAPDQGPVFRSESHRVGVTGYLAPEQLWRIVRDAAARAGINRPASPHWLRHAHASHALDRGAPIHLVQATLGHSSVATTGRYSHARPDQSSSLYLVGEGQQDPATAATSAAAARYQTVEAGPMIVSPPLNPDTLRWTRERLGLSVYALAQQLNLEHDCITGYEEGTVRLRRRPAAILRDWLESVHAGQEAVAAVPVVDGVALRQARARAALTQRELAALLGVDDDTIGFVETGRRSPTPRVATALAEWLAEARKTAIDGQLVRATREARGISMRALCARLGISPITLAKVEQGNHHPVGRVARVLWEWLEQDGQAE